MGEYIFFAIIGYILGSLAYWLPGRAAMTAAITRSKNQHIEQQQRDTKDIFATNVGRIANEITRLGFDGGKKFAYVKQNEQTECVYIHDEEQGKVYIAYNSGGVIPPPTIAPAYFTHIFNANQILGCYVDTGDFVPKDLDRERGTVTCTAYYALNIQTTDPEHLLICLPLIQRTTELKSDLYSSATAFATSVQASVTAIINSRNNG